MSIQQGENTIYATSFTERNVGKWFSQTKSRSEYSLLINFTHQVKIEVTNSRFSKNRRIMMNGKVVEKLSRTNLNNFRYSWTYPVGDMVLVFSIAPNKSASGTDLRVNGQDFFDFVYAMESDNPLGVKKSVYDTFMTFRVPPRNSALQSPRVLVKATQSPINTTAGKAFVNSGNAPLHANSYATLEDY
jgi:hypothetical protein